MSRDGSSHTLNVHLIRLRRCPGEPDRSVPSDTLPGLNCGNKRQERYIFMGQPYNVMCPLIVSTQGDQFVCHDYVGMIRASYRIQ
ncbi:hypothetical protein J6590_018826 [Homalodisca vitripennis]|nr:hypothetical protein J6590_018826 [Homalodisca vitripennis]